MRRALAVLSILAASTGAAAEEAPLSGAEFEAHVSGKTLFYFSGGVSYGAEQYLPGRRVIWTFHDGLCQEGHWYESDGLICFVYTTEPVPQCWSFWRRGGGLGARFEDDPAGSEIYETSRSDKPLICLGPNLGV